MDEKIINNIKSLAVDMISNANSGHTGIVLSSAPILYTLYAKHINIDVKNSNWVNRDRFVMSAGHGSALLYSVLHYCGFDLSIDDLKKFRQIDSKTPGHPEISTCGVDMSTGPLGQGIASAVGMAIASKKLESEFVLPNMGNTINGTSIFDYKVYVLCGDGDLMEGISYEASSLAGNLNLDNLIVLYDSNNISLDGDTSNTFTENVIDRFKAFGWYTEIVRNGNDVNEISNAITKAKTSGKPSFIEIKTVIGYQTDYEGTNKIHGKALNIEEVNKLKEKLNIPQESFYEDSTCISEFRKMLLERCKKNIDLFNYNMNKYINLYLGGDIKKIDYLFNNKMNVNLLDINIDTNKKATRDINHEIMQEIAKIVPNFIGGSADLSSSTKTYLDDYDDIKDMSYNGRNIWYGVREHAMGAISNGLALSNFRPFCSTFLTFSDYLKPAIRLSAIMSIPVTYIFSHDSISVGEDGTTHEPIEQLISLRSIPNLDVYRPCDKNELIGAWDTIFRKNNPSVLILSKEEIEPLIETKKEMVSKGAYIVRKEQNRLYGIIIATGSEVSISLEIANSLFKEKGIDIRVISMPSMELFLKQPKEYYNELLPIGYKTIVIEPSSSYSFYQFVYNKNYLITLDSFGASGKRNDVLAKYKYDYNSIKERVTNLLK